MEELITDIEPPRCQTPFKVGFRDYQELACRCQRDSRQRRHVRAVIAFKLRPHTHGRSLTLQFQVNRTN